MRIIDIRKKLPRKGEWQKKWAKSSLLVLHHDAVFRPNRYDSLKRYISQANYHISKGWPGLAYTYRIDNVGDIFYCNDEDTILWHSGTAKGNNNGIAICLDGNFEKQNPTEKQLKALDWLLRELMNRYNLTRNDVLGHRELKPTACPGKNLYQWLNDWRKKQEPQGAEKIYTEEQMTEMRHQRDRNWNLYLEEKAKREGLEKQVEDYKHSIEEIAKQLQCSVDVAEIRGKIEELLAIEDRALRAEGKVAELQKLVDKLNVDLDACEEAKTKALEQYRDTASALKEAQRAVKRVTELEKEVKRLEKRKTLDRFKTSELLPAVLRELWRRIFKK